MIADWLKRQYGLEAVRVTPIRSGPGSLAWQIHLADERCFCLKNHRTKTRARVDFEHLLIAEMSEAGSELSPRVVTATNGDTAVRYDEHLLSLYEFVHSDPPFDWTQGKWTERDCYVSGAALAEFHYYLDRCGQGENLIHGDFHPGNVLFRNGSVVAVVDLDFCRSDSRMFDVAYGSTAFAIDIPHGEFIEPKALSFLSGYNEKALSLGLEQFQYGSIQAGMFAALWLITAWLVEQSLLRLYIYHGYSASEHLLCET